VPTALDAPVTLRTCDEQIPPLPITRQFDFGQFITLYYEEMDPTSSDYGKPPRPVVITGEGGLATMGSSAQRATIAAAAVVDQAPPTFVAVAPTTIDVFDLMASGTISTPRSVQATIPDVSAFLSSGMIEAGGVVYQVKIDAQLERTLSNGVSTVVQASTLAPQPATVDLLLIPTVKTATLSSTDLNRLIAGERMTLDLPDRRADLSPEAIRALLDGKDAIVRAYDGGFQAAPVLVRIEGLVRRPTVTEFAIADLAAFLARPQLPGSGGVPIDFALTAASVDALRRGKDVDAEVGSATVRLRIGASSAAAASTDILSIGGAPTPPKRMIATQPATAGGWQLLDTPLETRAAIFPPAVQPIEKSLADVVLPPLPRGTGIPVALFVPWRQTWKLMGFSRGNLLQSLAMAPQEEITIEMSSWERRSGPVVIEESSVANAVQGSLAAESMTDTQDIFHELMARHDFTWQAQGAIDAGLSGSGITVSAGADHFERDAVNLASVAANSRNNTREATTKASASVRAKRATRISQSVEGGGAGRVVRNIRNANQCHTMTYDFFEVLAHYQIELDFLPQHLRLVALLPNPIEYPEFTPLVVRTHETALMRGLIDPALATAFEALRLTKAYELAQGILLQLTNEKKKRRDQLLGEFRTETKAAPAGRPITEETVVLEVLDAIQREIRTIRDTANEMPALLKIFVAIANEKPTGLTPDERKAFKHWLFLQLAAAKAPALLAALEELAKSTTVPDLSAARALIAALPALGTSSILSTLNDLSPPVKEELALRRAFFKLVKSELGWPVWAACFRDEGLYIADGLSIAGHLDALQKAFNDWEVARAKGEMYAAKEVLVKLAEARQELSVGLQDITATADKLQLAFPFEDVARAYERQEALLHHLNEYKNHYNYVLFQALPLDEQSNRIVMASQNKLQVGMFEPRVVAMDGKNLVVPLTTRKPSGLKKFVDYMASALAKSLAKPKDVAPEDWYDTTVVPTPGVTMTSRLGSCTTCESFVEKSRAYELVKLKALARQEIAEAARLEGRLRASDLSDPSAPTP
jgi:hypothetical protein